MIGQTISHFRILELLGSGGMGTVYKAEDTNLHRNVALKFLSPQLVAEEADKKRFLVEARSAAALNHVSICTVYSIEEHEDSFFIAMEYVPGRSLKDTITDGPLPLNKALALGAQIGNGLHLAHENGIIHRDIKPANIVATEKGQAKILDFGLARISGTTKVTITGTTLGTVAYMSPEQACGESIDHRTDIWSLGVLIYEMITGRQPFNGESDPAVIYSIMNLDPEPLNAFRSNLPGEIERILAKALAKDPDDRYQHADEFVVDLKRVQREGSSSNSSSSFGWDASQKKGTQRRGFSASIFLLVALIFLLLGGFLGKQFLQPPSAPSPVTQFTVPLPSNNLLKMDLHQSLTISGDGTKVAFEAMGKDDTQLFLHSLDQLDSRLLEKTSGATNPFFSPDGKWIGFFSGDKLKKINISDNSVLTLCAAPQARGAHWGTDGKIVLAFGAGNELFTVDDTGGTPEPIPSSLAEAGDGKYRWPVTLPENRGYLAVQWTGFYYEPSNILFIDPDSQQKTVLIEEGKLPVYVKTGHILFLRETALMALPFDLKSCQATGQPFMVNSNCGSTFTVSSNGTLVIPHGESTPQIYEQKRQMFWVERTGDSTPLELDPGPFVFPNISPDGKQLAITVFRENGAENRIYNLERRTFQKVPETGFDHVPVWAPDGRKIAFSANLQSPNVYIRSLSRGGDLVKLTNSDNHMDPGSWSSDGRYLSVVDFTAGQAGDISLVEFSDGGFQVKPFLITEHDERHAMISPDCNWMAFSSSQTGKREVFITPLDNPESQIRISTNGGSDPMWDPDGDEIFFWTSDEEYREGFGGLNTMMSVGFDQKTGQIIGEPESLFQRDWAYHSAGRPNYDISPDGDRFLLLGNEYFPPTHLRFILNWFTKFEELRR